MRLPRRVPRADGPCRRRLASRYWPFSSSAPDAQTTLVDELLSLFGGRPKPVMARLVESGRLTLEDIKEAEDALKQLLKKGRSR